MKCKICNNERDTRMGVCFDCVEAESIIADGVDMDDKGLKDNTPAKTPMEKVRLLIKHAWHTGNVRGW